MTNNGATVHIYILIMTVKTMVQLEILITRKPLNLLTMKITHLDHLLRETYIFQWCTHSCFHGNSSEFHMVVNS